MQGKQYIIMKASRLPAQGIARAVDAYGGFSCELAGVKKAMVYDDLQLAMRDAA